MEAFIVRATEKHGDKYKYPLQPFKNMTTEINVICSKHKTTNLITPSAHLRNGGGCKECSIEGRRLTMAQFIEKANEKHNNLYKYYPDHIYLGAIYKLTVNCSIHGDFEIQGGNHLNGHGCTPCGRENSAKLRSLTMAEVIAKTKEVHGDEYEVNPEQEYKNTNTHINVICRKHGEFPILPGVLMTGHGCKKCANEQNSISKMSNLPDFIAKSLIIHNNIYKYDATQEYDGYKKKLKITCEKHGDFYQHPAQHLSGEGCRKCAFDKLSDLFRSNIHEFIEKANIVHNNRYQYDNTQEYDGKTKLKITCKIHGEFYQHPSRHISGRGCRKCGYIKLADLFRSNIDEFIEKANIVHDNRYQYDNTQEYVGSYTPVKFICNEHGEFTIMPAHHLSGKGCHICFHRTSKISNEWLASIETQLGRPLQTNNSPEGEFRIQQPDTIYYYYADGYDAITNTIYEFHGDFWHGNPKIYPPEFTSKNHKKTMGERYADTIRKKETCLNLGYNYVEMWESDFINNK